MELKDISADFRYSVRSLIHRPMFAFVSILTIGLGMGGVLCILFVLNSVLLRRSPFPAPEKLVMVISTNRDAMGKVERTDLRRMISWTGGA